MSRDRDVQSGKHQERQVQSQVAPFVGLNRIQDFPHVSVPPPTRLPDLRSVIVLDSRHSGMFNFEDLMQAGSSQYVQQLEALQKKLSCDDPINIQFTSVNVLPVCLFWENVLAL